MRSTRWVENIHSFGINIETHILKNENWERSCHYRTVTKLYCLDQYAESMELWYTRAQFKLHEVGAPIQIQILETEGWRPGNGLEWMNLHNYSLTWTCINLHWVAFSDTGMHMPAPALNSLFAEAPLVWETVILSWDTRQVDEFSKLPPIHVHSSSRLNPAARKCESMREINGFSARPTARVLKKHRGVEASVGDLNWFRSGR